MPGQQVVENLRFFMYIELNVLIPCVRVPLFPRLEMDLTCPSGKFNLLWKFPFGLLSPISTKKKVIITPRGRIE